MVSTDFIVWGAAETSEGGEVTQGALAHALLPHNTRRCLVQPVLLTSNNAKEAGFVTPAGLVSTGAQPAPPPTPSTVADPPARTCTDFVLTGLAEVRGAGVSVEETSTALLRRNVGTKTRTPVTLTSNHARCSHFVTDGLCSAPLTNKDVLWMESVSGCKPGTLFKQFREASREPSSPCELPWDPMGRYIGLASAGALRTPRGHKSLEHL